MKKSILIIALILLLGLAIFIITAEIAAAPEKKAVSQPAEILAGYVAPANALPESPIITTLIFSGDVMLSRVVNQKMEKYGDWAWPFKNIASTTAAADITIINLESPFTISSNHLVKTGSFSFNADPRSIDGLKLAGVDVAALANNHMTNQGAKGISDTGKILSENNIVPIGAGLNSAEARQPVIKEVNGIKFGFLSYAYPDDYSVAGKANAGIANMSLEKMTADVKALKPQVDNVIILMHAGTEYVNKPNRQQTDFAHATIDAGADLVIGHHPHWVQTTEIYKGKPILYSLGNLIFDQMWSTETQEGALARIILKDKIIDKIEIIPISIHDYGQAVIVADPLQKNKILNRMGLKSDTIEF
ncbi:MAG: CapA family protein [Candidatus Buchananbacteria bacterium]|jgi:poly-gamma-glutamate synthesis protein (capsule biosynthesis protein)